jgi:methionine-rich copper-binding protein CopC
LVLASVVGLLVAGPSHAHSELVDADPADGAVLADLPALATLTFNEEIEPTLVRARLEWPGGASAVDPDVQQAVLRLPVGNLPAVAALSASARAGGYTVIYRVVSKDGHPVSGTLAFTVQAAEPSAATSPPTSSAPASNPPASSPHPTVDDETLTATTQPASQTSSGISPGALGAAGAVLVAGAALALVLRARRSGRSGRSEP